MKLRSALVMAAYGACATHALAQAASAEAAAPLDMGTGLVQTLAGLALVLALIFAATWLIRRISPSGRPNALLRVVASLTIGQRERVVLIEVGDQWLLLGVAPGAVRALQTLPKGVLPQADESHPFARLLAAARSGKLR